MRTFKTQAQIDEEARLALESTKTKYDVLKRLLIYARQSTKLQLQNNKESTRMQTVKLMQLGVEKGWSEGLTTVFIENKYNKLGELTEEIRSASGSLSIDERPGLKTVCDLIESGVVGAVMVFAVDRLFRDEDMVMPPTFVRLCKDYRVLIITQHYDFDFNNPQKDDRKRFLELAQAAADYTTHHVKGRMLVGKHEKAMRGEYAGWSVATGYILDDFRQQYIPNPHWCDNVASLFRRFRELDADFAAFNREIYGRLLFPDVPQDILERIGRINMSRVPGGYTIKGRTSLMAFLTNPVYIGHMVYKGQIVKYNAHPAIVDEQDFMFAFNALSPTDLEGNVIERPDKVVRYTHTESEDTNALLAGKRVNGRAVITSPQKSVYVMHYNDKEARYNARNFKDFHASVFTIQVSAIDALIEERLLEHLDPTPLETLPEEQTFEAIDRILKEVKIAKSIPADASIVSMQDQFQAVQVQEPTRLTTDENLRAELHTAIRRLDRDYEVNLGLESVSVKELRENREKKARHNRQLADLDTKQEKAKHAERDMQEATALLQSKNAREQWQAMKLEKRRKFIRLVTEDIIIEKVADSWLKLTIKWYAWIAQYKPHQALQQSLLFVDTGYILQRRSTLPEWTPDEDDIVRALYADASRYDLLQCLPIRSWKAIRSRAVDLKIVRERFVNESNMPDSISFEDMHLMQAHHLDLDRLEKRVWWTCDVVRNLEGQRTFLCGIVQQQSPLAKDSDMAGYYTE